jgi:hypothetical protein
MARLRTCSMVRGGTVIFPSAFAPTRTVLPEARAGATFRFTDPTGTPRTAETVTGYRVFFASYDPGSGWRGASWTSTAGGVVPGGGLVPGDLLVVAVDSVAGQEDGDGVAPPAPQREAREFFGRVSGVLRGPRCHSFRMRGPRGSGTGCARACRVAEVARRADNSSVVMNRRYAGASTTPRRRTTRRLRGLRVGQATMANCPEMVRN